MSTKDQIRILIRKIIREEIKEIVSQEVNAILAEKFVVSMNSKQSLNENFNVSRVESTPPKMMAQTQNSSKKEELKKSLLKKMGADENPMMALIYGDEDVYEAPKMVLPNGVVAPSSQPTQLPNGMIVDSDDEGIDISQFMRK